MPGLRRRPATNSHALEACEKVAANEKEKKKVETAAVVVRLLLEPSLIQRKIIFQARISHHRFFSRSCRLDTQPHLMQAS
jgi:hypothetical protein